MTFLELCQEVADESGTVAGVSAFNTIVGASGRTAKLVRWVRNAYRDIQNERPDWLWMRREFTKSLTIGKSSYDSAVDFNLSVAAYIPDTASRRTMSLYDPAKTQTDEGRIEQINWGAFRESYGQGIPTQNRPREWAVSPPGMFMVGPPPDLAYVLRGEYRMKPEIMTADGDIPSMPSQYHGVIVGEALRLMARSDEAFTVLAEKSQQYDRLRSALVNEQTPQMYDMWGGTLVR